MNNLAKRILVGGFIGTVFGVICAYMASTHGLSDAFNVSSAVFWNTVFNRMSVGLLIGIYGVWTTHPLLKSFKIGPILRGVDAGAWISLLLATGSLIGSGDWWTFGMIMIYGMIFGAIIDVSVTKLYGDGKDLLE